MLFRSNYKIFAIDEHIDRFFNSAGLIKIQVPCTKAELKALLQDLVNKMDTGDLFIYFQVTRGTAVRTHEFPDNVPANLWVMLKPMGTPDLYKKIRLLTQEDTRFFHCNIKTLNLLPSVMAAQKAKEAGCQEAVFHRGDRVTECAHSNCHILKDGRLITAPLDNLILPGIVLAAFTMGLITRTTRSNLLDVMSTDYIRTARAKGLSETSIIFKHALGNAIIPVLTVIGLGFGNLLGGMVLVETIFNWPGVGQFAYQSVMSNDYPAIIGVALLIALNYMVINTVVDILYGIIDPRVRCS